MVLGPRLDLRQTQALVMTPQLQQSLKLLQLSNLELTQHIETELECNPLLEWVETSEPAPLRAEAPQDSADALAQTAPLVENQGPLDREWTDYDSPTPGRLTESDGTDLGMIEAGMSGSRGSMDRRGRFEVDLRDFADWPEPRPTLRQHLLEQVGLTFPRAAERMIAAGLVESLDDAGYLTEPLESFANRFGCPREKVEAVLLEVQRFDPTGIGARSLRECLALQLAEKNRLDPAMQTLLDHLPQLAQHDLAGLRRLCCVDAEDLAEMIVEIRALNPKPGLIFERGVIDSVVPDILMHADVYKRQRYVH